MPTCECVADRSRRVAMRESLPSVTSSHGWHALEQRLGPCLTNGHPDLWRADPDLSFDSVVEHASRMCLTCGFDDPPFRTYLLHNESQESSFVEAHVFC
jgi:hypothetical protein